MKSKISITCFSQIKCMHVITVKQRQKKEINLFSTHFRLSPNLNLNDQLHYEKKKNYDKIKTKQTFNLIQCSFFFKYSTQFFRVFFLFFFFFLYTTIYLRDFKRYILIFFQFFLNKLCVCVCVYVHVMLQIHHFYIYIRVLC